MKIFHCTAGVGVGLLLVSGLLRSEASARSNGAATDKPKLFFPQALNNKELWDHLVICIQSHNPDSLRALLDRGVDPDPKRTKDDWSTVTWAVICKEPKMLEMLLSAGAEPDQDDTCGGTPLLRAVGNKDEECVKVLLAYGADPTMPSNHTSPLEWARFQSRDGYTKILSIIEKAAAFQEKAQF